MAMKALKKPTIGEIGAAPALGRLEKEELTCYEKKERLEGELAALVMPPHNSTDDVKALFNNTKLNMEADLLFAYKRWDLARKSLLEYDSAVFAQAVNVARKV